MQAITAIGLDIAKSVFQVHGVDADGNVVFRRQIEASILRENRRPVTKRKVRALLSPALFGAIMAAETEKWAKVIGTANIMPE
jgi:transposase